MSPTGQQFRVERGDHLVHFYRSEAKLADTVVRYLVDGFLEDGVAVVIASEPHRRAFEHGLAVRGLEPSELSACGTLIMQDARATLDRLLRDGRIEATAFDREVGGSLRAAGTGGRAVRAYGEMVDLLWQCGSVTAATDCERLWNELIADLRFSLLCAYPASALTGPGFEPALHELCRLHSAISAEPVAALAETRGAHQASRGFVPHAKAPRAARRFLAEVLEQWGYSGPVVEDARLLVSELVSNAVIHARSEFAVVIRRERSTLRLAVHDRSRSEPALTAGGARAGTGGWGLRLLTALASDWGFEQTPAGKVVWAALDLHPSAGLAVHAGGWC